MSDQNGSRPRHRNEYEPAKTDEPFTETLFGPTGIRVIHFVFYTLVFTVTTVLFDIVYAGIRTLAVLVMNIVGIAENLWGAEDVLAQADATLSTLFNQSLFNPKVVGVSIISALIITSFFFYWNEIRYKRGEWLRTFL